MKSLPRLSLALTLLLAGTAGAVQAQQRPAQTPSIAVTALNTTAAAEVAGRTVAPRATVLPNDVLRYTLTFSNASDKPLRNVELRDPIPAGVHVVAGSAHASRPDARLEFSADGGRSWSAEPTESVTVDGRAVVRPMPASRYTHLRWVVTGAVAPRTTVSGTFDARVGA